MTTNGEMLALLHDRVRSSLNLLDAEIQKLIDNGVDPERIRVEFTNYGTVRIIIKEIEDDLNTLASLSPPDRPRGDGEDLQPRDPPESRSGSPDDRNGE